jgi:hypothetical protein
VKNNKLDWIVVGGGIAGISVAEILCREGKSVLLLEKNELLVSETSKGFHEWMHSGALYSLVPDNLLTLRYLLGATDDLFEYYAGFQGMNLQPTETGVTVSSDGWFNSERIEFRYRIRRLNLFWMSLVSRSINIIDMIHSHDWLRRRAGSEYGKSRVKVKHTFNKISEQVFSKGKFYKKLSPDITMNSRVLINDLLSFAKNNGLSVKTSSSVVDIREKSESVVVKTSDEQFNAKNVVVCSPDLLSKIGNIPIKVSFAPIAIVENVPKSEKSFVELDYNIKTCINLLKKPGGIGQAGGISLDKESDVDDYLKFVIKEHKQRNPEIRIVDSYVGLKKELVQKGENRNYLYHINQNSSKVWSVVLGKFSLAFSMAPEFYRRIYHKNPTKTSGNRVELENSEIAETTWKEIIDKHRKRETNKWE